jgi:hypothetical protein
MECGFSSAENEKLHAGKGKWRTILKKALGILHMGEPGRRITVANIMPGRGYPTTWP